VDSDEVKALDKALAALQMKQMELNEGNVIRNDFLA